MGWGRGERVDGPGRGVEGKLQPHSSKWFYTGALGLVLFHIRKSIIVNKMIPKKTKLNNVLLIVSEKHVN